MLETSFVQSAVWARQLVEKLKVEGLPSKSILAEAGIDLRVLNVTGAMLPFEKIATLFERASELSGDDWPRPRPADDRCRGLRHLPEVQHRGTVLMIPRGGANALWFQGRAHYGQTAEDLMDPFEEEFDLLDAIVARRLRLHLHAAPGLRLKSLNGYRLDDTGALTG